MASQETGGLNMTIEEYLNKPYWVIDILPKQVSADMLELIGSLAGSEGLFLWR